MNKKFAIFLLPEYDYKAWDKQGTLTREQALEAMENYGKEVVERMNKARGDEYTCIYAWDFEALNGCRWISNDHDFYQLGFDIIAQEVWDELGY